MFHGYAYFFVILLLQVIKGYDSQKVKNVAENILVNTNVGPIRGIRATDGNYTMFMGIPFGEVDKSNPFGAAKRFPNFEEPFEAYQDSAVCPQIEEFNNTVTGTIDCLQLNVYVPDAASSTSRVPVMVWIYGGGFRIGFADRYLYGPYYLVRHDVILVTINYRLGPYGFMCLDTPQVSGNQGLKDQLLGLRWIKENIEFFGGDTSQITVFGQSAGSMSVHLHLLSPHEDLFQRVIMHSGSMYAPEILMPVDREAPIKLAGTLGYDTDDIDKALTFLAEQTTDSVITAAAQTGSRFWPCIESDHEGVEEFITDFAINQTVPKLKGKSVLLGFTDEEWLSLYANRPAEAFETITIFRDHFKDSFNFDENQLPRIEKLFKDFYLGGQDLSREMVYQISNFHSDVTFNYPTQRCIPIFLENGVENIFYYVFSYVGGRNFVRVKNNITIGGAVHTDDLGYIFDMQFFPEEPTPEDQLMIDRMTLMWTNFAKYGDPTPETTSLLPVKWEPIKAGDTFDNYLNIDSELTLGRNPFHERMSFWNLFYEAFGEYEKGYGRNSAGSVSVFHIVNLLGYISFCKFMISLQKMYLFN